MHFLTAAGLLALATSGVSASQYHGSQSGVLVDHDKRAVNYTDTQILEILGSATSCDDCQSAMTILQEVANEGDEAFAELSVYFCQATGEAVADVCYGLMQLTGPMIAASLRTMEIPSRTSTLLCATLYGLCSPPPVSNFTVPFPKPKPSPKPETTEDKLKKHEPFEVVHLSDVHVDLSYEVGASYNCTELICCRTFHPDQAPGVTEFPAGPWGNHNCDSPLDLEKALYAGVEKHASKAAFTLFTGDIVEGAEWLTTEKEIVNDINSVYEHMSALNLVYGTVGNHEANPVNSFPPTGVEVKANQSNQYMYNTLATNWRGWIGSEAAESVTTRHGAYSVLHPNSNLRIISINTMMYMSENFWLYTREMSWDPSSQFSWLISELQGAEDKGERVWIIGHIPFGRVDALYDYSYFFDQIVQRYDATIAALFFGHTHKDQWEVSYSDYSNQTAETATAIHYIAPALTPTSGNPNFRVYKVDSQTYEILDYTVWYANMSSPRYQTDGPKWEKYYSVKDAYGSLLSPPQTSSSTPLTPSFWHKVSELFEANQTVFQNYYDRKTRGWSTSTCTGTCKTNEICQMRSSQSQYACFSSEQVSVKKRGDNEDTTAASSLLSPRDILQSYKDQAHGSHGSFSSAQHDDDACPGNPAVPYFKAMGSDIKTLGQLRDKVMAKRRK